MIEDHVTEAPRNQEDIDNPSNIYLQSYHAYASTLRTWFVAYGIGGPVLFVTQEAVWKLISASPYAELIGILFLAGVGLQILLAMLNKNSMWVCFRGDGDAAFAKTRTHSIAQWYAHQYWIDVLIDTATAVCFVCATYLTYTTLMSTVSCGTR